MGGGGGVAGNVNRGLSSTLNVGIGLAFGQGGGQIPVRPLLPPVSASHWNTTAQVICANASVSMARYTPESRTLNQP